MMDGLLMLLTLSSVMAIASFLAGSLPLSFSLSQARLKLISTIGMGVLVGTALIVIIPEGVETLYSASDAHISTHSTRSLSNRAVPPVQAQPQAVHLRTLDVTALSTSQRRDEIEDTLPFSSMPGPIIPSDLETNSDSDPPKTPTSPDEVHILDFPSPSSTPSPSSRTPGTPHERTPHAWIGLALILGFIQMYLLDTLPSLFTRPRPPTQTIHSVGDYSRPASPNNSSSSSRRHRPSSTTLGLCIHSAADGIALGASSTSHSTKGLSLIIFFAIMVHKAPAAFGLTSVLLRQGLGKRGARAHLVAFAMAAPVGAVGTWMVVRMLGGGGGEGGEEEVMRWWTGVLLLFSGGTFLYVAMHTMQEEDDKGGGNDGTYPYNYSPDTRDSYPLEDGYGNGTLDGSGMGSSSSPYHTHHHHHQQSSARSEPRSLKLILAAVLGMLFPLVTQIGHAH